MLCKRYAQLQQKMSGDYSNIKEPKPGYYLVKNYTKSSKSFANNGFGDCFGSFSFEIRKCA